jgi:hypothetical protein
MSSWWCFPIVTQHKHEAIELIYKDHFFSHMRLT